KVSNLPVEPREQQSALHEAVQGFDRWRVGHSAAAADRLLRQVFRGRKILCLLAGEWRVAVQLFHLCCVEKLPRRFSKFGMDCRYGDAGRSEGSAGKVERFQSCLGRQAGLFSIRSQRTDLAISFRPDDEIGHRSSEE